MYEVQKHGKITDQGGETLLVSALVRYFPAVVTKRGENNTKVSAMSKYIQDKKWPKT
jgi:hypothetical protein